MVLSTPARGFITDQYGNWPVIYVATGHTTLDLWRDDDPYPDGVNWTYIGWDQDEQTSVTWPVVQANNKVFFGAYYHQDSVDGPELENESAIYAVEPVDFTTHYDLWPNLEHYRLRTAPYGIPSQDKPFGKFLANPCADAGGNPNVWFPTMDAASGPGKPAVVRALHVGGDPVDARAYFQKVMLSDGDEMPVTPILRNDGAALYPYVLTTSGKLWAFDPTSSSSPSGWPITVTTTKSIPRHDLAHDDDGGIILVTTGGANGGEVKCYWGT